MRSSRERRVMLPTFEQITEPGRGKSPARAEEFIEEDTEYGHIRKPVFERIEAPPDPDRVRLPSFAKMMKGSGVELPEACVIRAEELEEESVEGESYESAEADAPEGEAGEAPPQAEPSAQAALKDEAAAEIAHVEELCSNMRREAMKEAAAITAQAREEAIAVVGKAQRDMEKEIEKRTADTLKGYAESVGMAADALKQAREALCEALEPQFLETAILIAESILARELEANPETYTEIVRNVLERAYMAHELELHLPAERYDTLMEPENGPFAAEMAMKGIEVVRDPLLDETDCFIESDMGGIRGGVKTQLARIHYAASNEQIEVS